MPGRQAVIGARRAAALQRHLAPHCVRRSAGAALDLALPQRRCFAAGHGFPFGHGFPGGGPGQQPPPRPDSDKFYKLLDLDRSASEADIKKAYKKQAMKHHPDRGGDEATFKEISRAYEVLADADKKQIYDAYGEEGLAGQEQGGPGGPQPGMDPFDLFSQIFGFNAGRGPRGPPTTPDSTYELHLSLEELYNGTKRSIVFTRDALCKPCEGYGGTDHRHCKSCNGTGQQVRMHQMGMFVQQTTSPCGDCMGKGYVIPPGNTCKSCKGQALIKEKKTFDIDIDPGSEPGMEFRFAGQADEALGHKTGDVRISIMQKPHPMFKRTKDSLVMSKKITLVEALTGFELSIKFLDGKDLVIRSSPEQVVRPGDVMVIERKGMPRPHGQRPGDLFLMLEVEFPKSVPSESRGDLSKILGGKPLGEVPESAEQTKLLSSRQAQDLKRLWAQRTRHQQQTQDGQVNCQQQ